MDTPSKTPYDLDNPSAAEIDPCHLAQNLDRIADGLDIIADHLTPQETKIRGTAQRFRGIADKLRDVAKRVADDESGEKARIAWLDMNLLRKTLHWLIYIMFACFKQCEELSAGELWGEITESTKHSAGIALLGHVTVLEQYSGCVVAMLVPSCRDARFLRFRSELLASLRNYSTSLDRTSKTTSATRREGFDVDLSAVGGAEKLSEGQKTSSATADALMTATDQDISPLPDVRLKLPQALSPPSKTSYQDGAPFPDYNARERTRSSMEPEQRALHAAEFPKATARGRRWRHAGWWNGEEATESDFAVHDFDLSGESVGTGNLARSGKDNDSILRADCFPQTNAGTSVGHVLKEDICAMLWSEENSDRPAVLQMPPSSLDADDRAPQVRARWWHMHRQNTDFAESQAVARDAMKDHPEDEIEVAKALAEAQRQSRSTGRGDPRVFPGIIQHEYQIGEPGETSHRTTKIFFVSCPYGVPVLNAARAGEESRLPEQRDVGDASRKTVTEGCRINTPGQAYGCNATQVWFLVVGQDFVLSCAPMTLTALRQGVVSVRDVDWPHTVPEAEVETDQGRVWLVPGRTKEDDQASSVLSLRAAFGKRLTDTGGCDPLATLLCHNAWPVDGAFWEWGGAMPRGEPALRLHPTNHNLEDPSMLTCLPYFDEAFQVRGNDRVQMFSDHRIPFFLVWNRQAELDESRRRVDRLHAFLTDGTRNKHASSYRDRSGANRASVEALLKPASAKLPLSLTGDDGFQAPMIVTMGIYLFDFFWPPDHHHEMTGKFWGALTALLNDPEMQGMVRATLLNALCITGMPFRREKSVLMAGSQQRPPFVRSVTTDWPSPRWTSL